MAKGFLPFYLFTLLPLISSCSDMLETSSELVEFEKDNTLNHTTDSVYSVLGIINTIQTIADRTVLLGEVRGDLVITTDAASADSYDVSRKSASLLLESIMENESTAEFPVTVSMENDGTGWNITDSSALTDACFGGMAEAVEEFRKEDSADG